MEETVASNNPSVASTTYKVSFFERSTTGLDVSVAGPFYTATYKDDTGSHYFDHDGIADVGANGVVSFSTYSYSGQTVVQILVDNGRVTYVLGTSGGTYTLCLLYTSSDYIEYDDHYHLSIRKRRKLI